MTTYPEKPDIIWVSAEEADDKGILKEGVIARHKCGGPDLYVSSVMNYDASANVKYYSSQSGLFKNANFYLSELLFRIV